MAHSDWHNADIVAAVKKATGMSLRKLSESKALGPGTLQQALHRPYPKAERIIADAIGEQPQTIWPSRYNKSGPRKYRKSGSSVADRSNRTQQNPKDE
ncbi:helix-turn-helix domain-containing protein [Bowmanella denitrificans]|uniref:helix-turn-helix domain-containing protein n=1 Tax=Bowmanella denitrificans TaxID=366582 RepID=UPI000C999D20|nr:helix-turn-helix transcriptional regulator [Bowmanella denitrificans]